MHLIEETSTMLKHKPWTISPNGKMVPIKIIFIDNEQILFL